MLTKMILKNFKSFINETSIDFRANGYEFLSDTNKNSSDILKGALFVGSNASGKTNVIHALKLLLELLVWQTDIQFIFYRSFTCKNNDYMHLEYEFSIDNQIINYKIETDITKIVKEVLILNNNTILDRIEDKAEYFNGENNKVIISNLQNNQSVIRKIYFDTKFIDNSILLHWYEFLNNSIYIDQSNKFFTNNKIGNINSFYDGVGKDEFNKFLKEINYNQFVTYGNSYKNPSIKLENPLVKQIFFVRDDIHIGLPLEFESEGNRTLVVVLPQIFQAIKNNCMIIIDEFGSSFHNSLEEKIIRYFMKHSKDSQMFVVSHSTNLLSNKLLRPDQIYSVDYIKGKGSVVNRFSNSKPREAQNLEKMYLSGVFDGIPNIK